MRLDAIASYVPSDPFPVSWRASGALVGESVAFRCMLCRLELVARTEAVVLLLGETGTGKGLAAQRIHELSPRYAGPFVTVDCGSLPATLIESELFGHEKGAFTDARTRQAGRFELANGGTLFLDEIGEFPLEAQSKLLRVLQHKQFERLGSPKTIGVDVRVIAATNRDLAEEVAAGRFRRDLFYRLGVFPINMPSLRERRQDIPILVRHFVRQLALRHRKSIDDVPAQVFKQLATHDWPGNVRELENVLERAVIMTEGTTLHLLEPLRAEMRDRAGDAPTTALVDIERGHIVQVLHAKKWRIEGPQGAAAALGLKPSTLRSRMRKLGVQRVAAPGVFNARIPGACA